jgi:ABC-2 type transport system permease protein
MKIIKSLQVFNKYRYLLSQLVSRDFKVKYKRSVLGVLWSVLNPLLTMVILYVVFTTFFGMRATKSIKDYSVYLLSGLVFWNYFAEATNLSLGAVVTNFNLLTKVYMPKYIFTISKVLSSAVNMVFSLVALYLIVGIEAARGMVPFGWTNILLPYDMLMIVIFAMGVGLVLSALTVFFRDMFYIWGVVLTAWMYFSPIMYGMDMVTNSHSWYTAPAIMLMKFNPMYHYLNFARKILLYNQVPAPSQFLYTFIFSAVMLVIGILFFRSKQDKFVYYI